MKNGFSVTIKRSEIFYFFAIFPFFPIDYFSYFMPVVTTFCTYMRIFIVLLLLYRLLKSERGITVPFVIAILFFVATLISSYLSDLSLNQSFHYGICILGVCLIVQDGVSFNIDSFIKGTLLFFELLVYANLLYFIINPSGYIVAGHNAPYYLLGNYNSVIRKLFPGLVIGALYSFHSKGRLTGRFLIMLLAVLFFLIMNNAVTAIIGLLVFVIGLIMYSIFDQNFIFKYEYFFLISIAITIIFVIIGNFSFFETIITGLFGKSMTLSSRTKLWAQALIAIPQKFLWGYGLGGANYMRTIISGVAAHNIYLDILLFNGIVGMILFGFILYFVWEKIKDCRKSNSAAPVIFDCAFSAIFIMWNFEPFGSLDEFYKIFIIFTMAYFCDQFLQYCPIEFSKNKMQIHLHIM